MGYLQKSCDAGPLNNACPILELMITQGILIPTNNISHILQRCIRNNDLEMGRKVYLMIENEVPLNIKLGCQFIRMFALCGSMHEALQVFSRLQEQDVYAWTAIILAHAQKNQGKKAMILFNQMQSLNVTPSAHTFVAALKACASIADLDQGKCVHVDIIKHGLELDLYIGSALVDMYTKCGNLDAACKAFDKLPSQDVVSWSAMIAAYAQSGNGHKALQLFRKMQKQGSKPNQVTFVNIVKACASVAALDHGKLIHTDIMRHGVEADLYVGNSLVDMYAKCSSLENARVMFDLLPIQDVVSWNAMIAGYVELGDGQEALQLFRRMQCQGKEANEVSYVCVLKACANTAALDEGKRIHAYIRQGFETDLYVQTTLVDMYAKCGSLNDARKVFNNLEVRNTVSWNSIIAAYAQHGQYEDALQLLNKMQKEGTKPNQVTCMCILQICATVGALQQGRLIHFDIMKQGFESDLFIGSSLVDTYAKCGNLEEARSVFDKLLERNVVTWNAMIAGYAEQGHSQEALQLFKNMQLEGIKPQEVLFVCILKVCSSIAALEQGKLIHADIVNHGLELDQFVGSTLSDMYIKCGSLENARKAFDNLQVRDVVTWSAIIGGYVECGYDEEAIQLVRDMQEEGIQPNEVTFMYILKACSGIGALDRGKLIHADIMRRGLETDLVAGSSLIDMYAKCGSLRDAHTIFIRLPEKNVVSWCAVIGGYAEHGYGGMALQLFIEMQEEGIEPDMVTLLSVLKACSSIASLERGKLIHVDIIKQRFDSDMYTGNTLVDMYGKCGSLEDACKVFDRLPVRDVVSWNAMIAGYAEHGHCELAQQYFESMQKGGIDPNGITFVCLLSACNHAGLIWEAHSYFQSMRQSHGLAPTIEHYGCMVDILGRAGSLNDAVEFVSKMPLQPTSIVWVALLGSCAKYGNLELGRWAFDSLLKSCCKSTAGYVLMSNIYAVNHMWEDAQKTRDIMPKSIEVLGFCQTQD